MASEMVERLAKKYANRGGVSGDIHGTAIDVLARPTVCFFLNAIADELDKSEDGALEHIGQYESDVYSGEVAASWLRAQASEADDD